jgi:hypothetical protein
MPGHHTLVSVNLIPVKRPPGSDTARARSGVPEQASPLGHDRRLSSQRGCDCSGHCPDQSS